MEYERIHKLQMGVISPSKLRIKLLGSHGGRKKEGGSNSSRTSPSKLEEMECSKNSLLAGDLDEGSLKDSKDASSLAAIANAEVPRLDLSVKDVLGYGQGDHTPSFRKDFLSKMKADVCCNKTQDTFKSDSNLAEASANLSTVHPMRLLQEDGLGYDSGHDNGSVRSFEFHRERSLQPQVGSPFLRSLPSKWNDAERWIVHRQIMHLKPNVSKKAVSNRVVFVPEADLDFRRSGSIKSASQTVVEKFSFVPNSSQSSLDSSSGASGLTDLSSVSSDHSKPALSENATTNVTVCASMQSVSMRDIGTEMTPIPSQDPSRTGTPLGATTPLRSPLSSIPSSPKKGAPAPSAGANTQDELRSQKNESNRELSDKELQLKTRREIAALGIQLGKLNIASWAGKEDIGGASPSHYAENTKRSEEYEAQAAAWEESQKSEYTARYRREEANIQAWENHRKAKYETKLRRIEAQAERMKARAQDKMVEKLALTRRRVEQKQAISEAKRKRQAARTTQQADQIRRTGRISTLHFWCCGWFL